VSGLPAVSLLRVALRPAVSAARLGGRALDAGAVRAVDVVLDSRVAAEVADRVAESPLVERAVARALQGPLVEAITADIVRYAVLERMAEKVLEGDLVDRAVARLLEREELWLLVDEIARSPAVTDAIAQQSLSFADQVADGVRARSRSADAWLERAARKALRRRPAPRTELS
jgi:hypothetical protein